MKFCTSCDNMYYIRIHGTDAAEMEYYCKKCGTVESTSDICVLQSDFTKKNEMFRHILNPYVKDDPTLPRIYGTMKCPSQSCVCNNAGGPESEIIYMRYDNENMKYLYMCVHCNFSWKL
jgi:DNA-directed RNA polymerase subunit M/transcription elongation factor TFIIS